MLVSTPGFLYWTDYIVEGNHARVIGHYRREQKDAAIEPRTEFSMKFYGQGGDIRIGVRATPFRPAQMSRTLTLPQSQRGSQATSDPLMAVGGARGMSGRGIARLASDHDRPGLDDGFFDPEKPPIVAPPDFPEPTGGGGGTFQVAVRIQLFAPGIEQAVQTWDLPEGVTQNIREVAFNPQGFPTPDAPVRRTGWWRVTVTPMWFEPVNILIEARSTRTLTPFHTAAISRRLFNHLFRVVLEVLVPVAKIENQRLLVSIGEEIAAELGISRILKNVSLPSYVGASGKLTSLNITAVSGRDLREVVEGRIQQRFEAAEELKGSEDYWTILAAAEAYKDRLEQKIRPVQDGDITIRIQAGFEKVSASIFGFDVGRLNGEFGELYLSFSHSIQAMNVVSFLDVDFSTLADIVLSIASLFVEVKDDLVNTIIEETLESPEIVSFVCNYLRGVLSRAVGQQAVLRGVWFANDAWQVRYYNDPPLPANNVPWHITSVTPLGGGGGGIEPMDNSTTLMSDGSSAGDDSQPRQPLDSHGVIPSDFQFESGDALARLDRHKTLVFIMMENRSYDHLFGGLAAARPRVDNPYDGPSRRAMNASAGGFLDGVPIVETRKIAMDTSIPVSPRHSYKATRFQIGDGTENENGLDTGDMNGFARDLERRTDSPQMAMTVYGEADLPVYYKLADEFCVCDRWFAAHPGPTWPNRIATLTGSIPEVENFEIDDPRIGFLKQQTVFDVLTNHGIDWKVFESDLSLIRMFDRFRLDDQHVVPIDDQTDGLDATFFSGRPLPRVIFVEPNFADIPPLSTANDDHPPADLAAGQKFIARVCDAIWASGHFTDCLLCITYDEHGGFYDHVPPPGTFVAEGRDHTKAGLKPKMHPNGPGYLGVRVPAMIISPYVSAGKADRTVFDHTSILKTILVHNRERLGRSVGSFGARVDAAAHLGQALDLSSARQPPQAFDIKRRRPTSRGTGIHGLDVDPTVATDSALDSTTQPPRIPPRTITIVPRPEHPAPMSEDLRDFHTALRNSLKPRKTVTSP